MTKVQTVNILAGQMNLDKDPRLIDPQKEYTYANNFRNNNSADGSEGSGGNIKGNSEIVFSQPGGVNTVIGEAKYEKQNATIFFVYNSVGRHQIRMLKEGFIYPILEREFLNFHPDYRIKAAISNDSIYWTDGRNEPRTLDLERLWNYYNYTKDYLDGDDNLVSVNKLIQDKYEWGGIFPEPLQYTAFIVFFEGNAYNSKNDIDGQGTFLIGKILPTYREITNNSLKFIADPFYNELLCEYKTITEITQNNLLKNQYKFVTSVEYLDGRKSVYSTRSILPQPKYNETTLGVIDNKDDNNAIEITFSLERRDISKIYFGAIRNDSTNVMIFDTLNIYDINGNINNLDDKFSTLYFDGRPLTYQYFQDDGTYIQDDAIEFNRLYDHIPPIAKSLELTGDRVLIENMETGFDKPIVSSEISVVEVPVNMTGITETGTFTSTTNSYTTIVDTWNKTRKVFNNEFRGGVFTCKIYLERTWNDGANSHVYLNSVPVTFKHNAAVSLSDFLSQTASSLNAMVKNKLTMYDFNPNHDNRNVIGNIASPSTFNSVGYDFYLGGSYGIDYLWMGKIYKYNYSTGVYEWTTTHDRVTSLITDLSYSINYKQTGVTTLKSNSKPILGIKYLDASFRESGVVKLGYVNVPRIGNKLHVSTYYWDTDEYYKRQINCKINHTPPEWATSYVYCLSRNNGISAYQYCSVVSATTNPTTDTMELDINEAITNLIGFNSNYQLGAWTFEKGDRLRLVGSVLSDPSTFQYYYDFDVEIMSQNTATGHITIPKQTIGIGYVVEVYRPTRLVDSNNDVFYEISNKFKIENGFHTGNITDQDISTPAESTLEFGDTYLILRGYYFGSGNFKYSVAESDSVSDYYINKTKGYGRPGFVIENMKRKYHHNLIRFGGLKNYGTNYNQIARFSAEDYEYLPEQYGEIAGAVSTGDTISVIQASKLTTYYVQKSVLNQADGTTLYVVSDKVLNNKNESIYNYGSVNPESIVNVNGTIYYFDAIRGAFIRKADNGQFPISDYGINRLAKLLGKAVINQGVKVYAGYDEYNKEVVWAWNWDSEDNVFGYGISFVENGNQWKSFQDFYLLAGATKKFVSLLSSNVNQLVSFVEGRTFLHDSNVLYNTLYERTVTTEVEVVGNSELLQNKIFDYVTVESDHEWFAAERDNNGNIIATENFVDVDNGLMKSLIPSMRKKEENYVSEFGRDTLTKMVIPTLPSGITSEMYKYLNGRRLRGKFVKVKLRNNSTDKVKIFSVIINASISERL